MDYTLSEHAETTIYERGIKPEWIDRALDDPDLSPHKSDPTLPHVLKRIPENENRVLRVVYNTDKNPINIVTAYFDRTMKGKL